MSMPMYTDEWIYCSLIAEIWCGQRNV